MTTRWTGRAPTTRRAPDAPQVDQNATTARRTSGRRRGRAGVQRPELPQEAGGRLSRLRPGRVEFTTQLKLALSGIFFGSFLIVGGLFIAFLSDDEARIEQWGLIGAFFISLFSSATVVLPAPGMLIIIGMAEIIDPWQLGVVTGVAGGLGGGTAYLAGSMGRNAIGSRSRISIWMFNLFHSRWGAVLLFLGNLIPFAPGDAFSAIAGVTRYPVYRFFIYVIVATVIKMIAISWLGRLAPDLTSRFMG